ncbi:mannose-6-phosphate isomerase, class I [Marinoscillum sp. MHG1-6]|uniref:mannose-6-phosphate isomerase, class I n=1 Tax=Marinoscillum sp. MHG1-6 TaxID=2959627 RepID=UPI0021572DBF|nr:mannose-6-phosphate isomerase, class I [Marinoscillum sp. MHG1-6]
MALFKIKGVVQNYAWGGSEYIPRLIGQFVVDEKCAEYWMGAHDKAPAIIEESGEPLNEFISKNPRQVLGEQVYDQFGRLPFLFKVLDVYDMLSIQVHPSKAEAEKGFARENEAGIPLSAPHRNYKDDNHKPEIMVALSEFWLLHGFLPKEDLKKVLRSTPELNHLLTVFEEESYRGLYQTIMEEPAAQTNATLQPLIDRILPLYESESLDKSSPEYWASKAYLSFCPVGDIDKGIYSIFFFNIVKVNEGEAVFQDAGVPHAYMEGHNMELMANSDNVLRGGLTPKHVDVAELLKHVSFKETIPNILEGEIQTDEVERIYKSPAPDFELSKIDLDFTSSYRAMSLTLEIMIVLEGEVKVSSEDESIELKKGEVFVITSGSSYHISTNLRAQIYKAKCPV